MIWQFALVGVIATSIGLIIGFILGKNT